MATEKVNARTVDVAALEEEARKANDALAEGGPTDPFEGDSVSVEVTKQINLAQFQAEISKQVGRDVQVSLWTGEIGRIATKKEPGRLFASPSSVGERSLTEAVERHVADDEHETLQPASTGPAPVTVQFDEEAQAVLDKIRDGGTATTKELTAVVAALAGVKTEE